jgi:hypothetical protein
MTSLPRLSVVNLLLSEWKEKSVLLTRKRLYQADPSSESNLELYLNYVEMLKAEGVSLEADMYHLRVQSDIDFAGSFVSETSLGVAGCKDDALPELIRSVYAKDIVETAYGSKSVYSLYRLMERCKVPLSDILKGGLAREGAVERLSWLNRLVLDYPSRDSAYLFGLLSGDIYNSLGGSYLASAEVFYGIAYSMASTPAQRAVCLVRFAIVTAKLKSTERKWLGRLLVSMALQKLAETSYDDERVSTNAECLSLIASLKVRLSSPDIASIFVNDWEMRNDNSDHSVLGVSLVPIDLLDFKKISSIEVSFQELGAYAPDTVKFYQRRFIASYLCLSSFLYEGLESGFTFANRNCSTLGVNSGSFEFLYSHCLQYLPLMADDASAADLRRVKGKVPDSPGNTDDEL